MMSNSTPQSSTTIAPQVSFSSVSPSNSSSALKQSQNKTLKQKWIDGCNTFRKTRFHKFFRRYFRSNLYFILGITLTLAQLIFSALAKILDDRNVSAGTNAFVTLFMIVMIYQIAECTLRIIIIHSYGAVFDGIILYTDLGINLYVVIMYGKSGWSELSKAFGIFNTTRLLFFIADTGVLKNIFRNLSKGIGTIILVFLYCATWIYTFAIVTYFIYNPFFFQSAKQCPICESNFKSLELSFLTAFQILTFDNWCSGIIIQLMQQAAVFSTFTWVYFVLFICFSAYLMVNIITSIILQILLDLDNTSQDTGNTLLNILHQLFGWVVVLARDIRIALVRNRSAKDFFRRIGDEVMQKREKSVQQESDKLSSILDKITDLDKTVDRAYIVLQKMKTNKVVTPQTQLIKDVQATIATIQNDLTIAMQDQSKDAHSVLLGNEMEKERRESVTMLPKQSMRDIKVEKD